jgi:tRNA-modifying protein YgfZ
MAAARISMTFQHNTQNRPDSSPAYEAARSTAAWFERSAEGRLLVSGQDRATWLQGLLTNDILALAPGTGCYAAHLTPQGRMVSDMRLLETGHEILMDVPASTRQALLDRFDMFIITEDVRLTDATPLLAQVTVVGPSAASAAAALARAGLALAGAASAAPDAARATLAALAEHEHVRLVAVAGEAPPPSASAPAPLHEAEGLVAGSRDAGLPGLDLYVAPQRAASLRAALEAEGVIAGDDETFETLRIEAGRPRFGVDMDGETIPLEAGIEDRAISFTKGCYVGQEIIVRVRDRGHGRVARRLVGLRVEGAGQQDPAALAGAPLSREGKNVGRLTSAARARRVGGLVALGYVHRDAAAEGTVLDLATPSGPATARVTSLPIVEAPAS